MPIFVKSHIHLVCKIGMLHPSPKRSKLWHWLWNLPTIPRGWCASQPTYLQQFCINTVKDVTSLTWCLLLRPSLQDFIDIVIINQFFWLFPNRHLGCRIEVKHLLVASPHNTPRCTRYQLTCHWFITGLFWLVISCLISVRSCWFFIWNLGIFCRVLKNLVNQLSANSSLLTSKIVWH